MDKITTPIAILVSGILIFIGLLMNYNNGKYFVTTHKYPDSPKTYVVKHHIHKNYTCVKQIGTNKYDWYCDDENYNDWEKRNGVLD